MNLNTKINDISATFLKHSQDIIDQEQYTRRDMVEFNNIPQIEGENITKIILKLMDVLKMDLNKYVLDVVHRLSNKPDSHQSLLN